ncbi:MAG: CDP-alcohol phosphatidyltransferase family protein [Clostridia bacterium]|nr:CDP-alcohol phosphatidyltransferase family protein [Clostridia bacterium]
MLGVYNYTVWLTYLSLLSSVTGIIVALDGTGHPFYGTLCLLLCGLFDAFDGKVARTKKTRTNLEVGFGIQIDSLSDLVAFGVLPGCIGVSILMVHNVKHGLDPNVIGMEHGWIYYIIVLALALAALVRLAYFNVTEEERQKEEGGVRRYYEGLPVTASSLIFPIVICVAYMLDCDPIDSYFPAMLLTALAFVSRIRIPKPGLKGILVMVFIGALALTYMAINGILIR